MTHDNVPVQPAHSFRVVLELNAPARRLDQVLIEALRGQRRNDALRRISRTDFKELFTKKKIRIKGQIAVPSSGLAKGTTYVDILGFGADSETKPAAATE